MPNTTMKMPTKAKILQEAKSIEIRIRYFREKAPYFPDYYYEVGEENGKKVYHITSIVRHEHQGSWYSRHHYTITVAESIHDAMREFLRQVYLDMKFGKIDPDFKRPNDEPLDPKDDLQVNEKKRLGI